MSYILDTNIFYRIGSIVEIHGLYKIGLFSRSKILFVKLLISFLNSKICLFPEMFVWIMIAGNIQKVICHCSEQWFSAFFCSRHTKHEKKNWRHTYSEFFWKRPRKKEFYFRNCNQNLLIFLKRVVKVRTKKIGGTLGRSSRHIGWETLAQSLDENKRIDTFVNI